MCYRPNNCAVATLPMIMLLALVAKLAEAHGVKQKGQGSNLQKSRIRINSACTSGPGPDFKDLFAWTKCLLDFLNWTRYLPIITEATSQGNGKN